MQDRATIMDHVHHRGKACDLDIYRGNVRKVIDSMIINVKDDPLARVLPLDMLRSLSGGFVISCTK